MATDDESTGPAFAHDAFISYSRQNKEFAARLEKALEAFKPPREPGFPPRSPDVFRDEDDFTGVDYQSSVDKHLRASRKLIVVCTPEARQSRYVNDEVRHFAQANGADNIIPLLLAGIPNNEVKPDQDEQRAFPEALCDVLDMPLAANYRDFDPRRDKVHRGAFEGSWYSLLANLYGVSRSVIEQRDRRRRARVRNFWITGLSVVGVALLGLTAWALVSRHEAVRQQQIAEERRRAALARQLNVQSEAALDTSGDGLVKSLLLTVESLRAAWTPEAYAALANSIDLLPRPPAERRKAHAGPVGALAVSADGAWLASDADDGTVVWDLGAGAVVHRLPPQSREQQHAVAFSPDRRWLVTGCGHEVCVWDVATSPSAPRVRLPHGRIVRSVAFSPDGRLLATVSYSSPEAKFFDTATWTEQRPVALTGGGGARTIAYSPDGRWVAMDSPDGVKVWDVSTRQLAAEVPRAGRGIAFAPDGPLMATGGSLQVWTLSSTSAGPLELTAASGGERPSMGGDTNLAFSPDGAYVAGADRGVVRVVEVATRREVSRLVEEVGPVVFSRDGRWLFTGNKDGTVARWAFDVKETVRLVHDDAVRSVTLSPDDRWLTTATAKGALRKFRRAGWKEEACPRSGVKDTLFSSDSALLALLGEATVAVVATESCRASADAQPEGGVREVGFSPDGRWLVVIDDDGTRVRLLGTADGRQAAPPLAHERQVRSVAFSPDGRWVMTRTYARASRGLPFLPSRSAVWDVATGTEAGWKFNFAEDLRENPAARSQLHAEEPQPAAGGNVELAASATGWPQVVTSETRRPIPDTPWLALRTVQGKALSGVSIDRAKRAHRGEVTVPGLEADGRSFSTDGRWLVTAGTDGTVRVWDLAPDRLADEACARLPRNLTAEEWRQYFGEDEPLRATCPR